MMMDISISMMIPLQENFEYQKIRCKYNVVLNLRFHLNEIIAYISAGLVTSQAQISLSAPRPGGITLTKDLPIMCRRWKLQMHRMCSQTSLLYILLQDTTQLIASALH